MIDCPSPNQDDREGAAVSMVGTAAETSDVLPRRASDEAATSETKSGFMQRTRMQNDGERA